MRELSRRLVRHPAVRFLISGGLVAVVSISLTTLLKLLGLPFQVAFVIGYCTALGVHFALHRNFTFAGEGEYALAAHHQARRFLLVALTQYAIIAVGVAVLAPLLGLREMVVYLSLIVLMAVGNFFLSRRRIFHTASVG